MILDKTIQEPNRLAIPAREAARLLSISERSLWALSSPRGPVPAIRLGRSVRYCVATLQEWLTSQQTAV